MSSALQRVRVLELVDEHVAEALAAPRRAPRRRARSRSRARSSRSSKSSAPPRALARRRRRGRSAAASAIQRRAAARARRRAAAASSAVAAPPRRRRATAGAPAQPEVGQSTQLLGRRRARSSSSSSPRAVAVSAPSARGTRVDERAAALARPAPRAASSQARPPAAARTPAAGRPRAARACTREQRRAAVAAVRRERSSVAPSSLGRLASACSSASPRQDRRGAGLVEHPEPGVEPGGEARGWRRMRPQKPWIVEIQAALGRVPAEPARPRAAARGCASTSSPRRALGERDDEHRRASTPRSSTPRGEALDEHASSCRVPAPGGDEHDARGLDRRLLGARRADRWRLTVAFTAPPGRSRCTSHHGGHCPPRGSCRTSPRRIRAHAPRGRGAGLGDRGPELLRRQTSLA